MVGTFVFRDIIKKTKQGRDKIEGVLEKKTFSCITVCPSVRKTHRICLLSWLSERVLVKSRIRGSVRQSVRSSAVCALIFVRDGILSVADYNSTRVGVVVVVVISTFLQWDNLSALSYQVKILYGD